MKKETQALRKALLLIVLLLTLLAVGSLSVALNRYFAEKEYRNRAHIYGEWIEQDVPHYARDSFIVREEGIYVEERIVDTNYTFDGRELRYHYKGKEFIYKVKNDEVTEMQRVAPEHYFSMFQLEGVNEPESSASDSVQE